MQQSQPLNEDPWPQTSAAPISFAAASSIIAAQSAVVLSDSILDRQTCELSEAPGLVLADAVIADRDQPPFPRVTRDGFALRAQDLADGTPLRVVGQLRAGEAWPAKRPELVAGEAVEIMTGASLPPGADAVLMVEHAQEIAAVEGEQLRSLLPCPGRTLIAGENVVPRGSEARLGDVLLEPGTRLYPEQIALSASCGLRSLLVYQPPKVAILSTGDELREPPGIDSDAAEAAIESHQIYDSNSHSLAALVQEAHAIPLRLRAARDHREDLATRIRQALKLAPLLLLTGGVSMGRYDLVEEVLADLGAEFFFTGVKMRPGKPVVFGRVPAGDDLPARFFFGLPGNPISAMVTFRVFVQPLLAAMAGERQWQPRIALAMLATELRSKSGLTRFLPAHLDTMQPVPIATPVHSQGSGDLAANARANCYVIVPEDCEILTIRDPVRVLLR
jgi:molybdopterin molybdotransferase